MCVGGGDIHNGEKFKVGSMTLVISALKSVSRTTTFGAFRIQSEIIEGSGGHMFLFVFCSPEKVSLEVT